MCTQAYDCIFRQRANIEPQQTLGSKHFGRPSCFNGRVTIRLKKQINNNRRDEPCEFVICVLPCCYSDIWQLLCSSKGHIVCSNCRFTASSVTISDLLGLEKLTHSKRMEPKLSYNVCHHVNTNKGIRFLTWVVAPISVIYSLKPHIPTHLKSLLRPDWDNLSQI